MDNNSINPAPATPAPPIQPETNNPAPSTPVTQTQPVTQNPEPQPVIGGQPTSAQPVIAPNKKSKAPLIIISVLVVLLVVSGILAAIFVLVPSLKSARYIENAEQLSQKISSANSESLIFFDKDLEDLSADLFKNPDGEKYGPESYATYFDQKAIVCLNDEEKRVDNINGNMEVKDVKEAGKCKLEINERDTIKYLNNYYEKKYELKVKDNDTKKVRDQYAVFTDKGAIYATFELKDKKITIEDDYEQLIKGYSSIDEVRALIANYINELQKDKDEDDEQIVDLRMYNQEYFILQSTLTEDDAIAFTKELGAFLESKNIQNLELYVASYSYQLVEGQTQIVIDYRVALFITKGEVNILTDKDKNN